MRGLNVLALLMAATTVRSEPVHETIHFQSGGLALAGTLVLPSTAGPHPAAVFVHGSGPHTREGAVQQAGLFTDAGVALLAFDKRGTGQSAGSWTSASLFDLAGDIAAAVARLREDPRIDPDRIGLWGVSQGGWIGPLVIAEDPRIAFLMVISGGGVSPLQSELYSYQQAFDHAGLSPEIRAEAFSVIGRYFRYLGTGKGRMELVDLLEEAQDRPWYAQAPLKRILPDEEGRRHWAWVAAWDPLLSIAAVRCPVLLVFGDRDRQQPTDRAIERWRQGLMLAGNRNMAVEVFEGADHGIRLPGEGHDPHARASRAPGYGMLITNWLRQTAGR